MDTLAAFQDRLGRAQKNALIAGVVGAVLCAIACYWNSTQFFRGYLIAFLFWNGLALGCLSLAMVHHLTGGRWGLAIRRFLESGYAVIPLMAVLFLPLVFGVKQLYPWTDTAHLDAVLQRKVAYLNLEGFYIRAVVYFVIWIILGFILNSWSLRRDRNANFRISRRMQLFSGPGILVYALSMTFAAVDWGMSLEPHWFSTMYGVLFMIGQALNALAFVIAVAVVAHAYKPFSEKLSVNIFHDLGNMLLAAVMLWAYVNFSQYLIIWSGNLPEETPFYVVRSEGGWNLLGMMLISLHFFVPFLLLLNRMTKRNPKTLQAIALGLIVMRLIDVIWTIAPAYPSADGSYWIPLIAALIGIGGFWIAMFCSQLKSRAEVPVLVDPH